MNKGERGGGWIYVTLQLGRMGLITSLVFRFDGFGFHLHMLQKGIYRKDRWLTADIRLCLTLILLMWRIG